MVDIITVDNMISPALIAFVRFLVVACTEMREERREKREEARRET